MIHENSTRLIFRYICNSNRTYHRGKSLEPIILLAEPIIRCRRNFHSIEENRHTWTIVKHLYDRDIKNAGKKFACFLLNITDESFKHFERHKYLWDEANLKVAVDGSANCLARKKIIHTADVVCGDFDSIDPKLLEQLRCPTKISKLPIPKDKKIASQTATLPQVIETPSQKETDFTKAVRVALNKRPDIHNFIGLYYSDGTRTDHLFGLVNTLHLIRKNIILINVLSNTASWLLCPGSTEVKTEGLEYNVHSGQLNFGGLISTSNICDRTSLLVKVDTDRDILWSVDVGTRADQ